MPNKTAQRVLSLGEARKLFPRRLLLVEDIPEDAIPLLDAFRSPPGWEVAWVRDGEKAVDYVLKTPPYSRVWTPTLIVLNLNLPKRNGHEVLRKIKSDPTVSWIPVVIWSISERLEDFVLDYRQGAAAYVTKRVELAPQVAILRVFWDEVQPMPSCRPDGRPFFESQRRPPR